MEHRNGVSRLEVGGVCRRSLSRRRTRETQREAIPGWSLLFLLAIAGTEGAPAERVGAGTVPLAVRQDAKTEAKFQAQMSESFGRLPLLFETAEGSATEFRCRGSSYYLFLSPTQALLSLNQMRAEDRGMRNEQLKLRGMHFPASRALNNLPQAGPLRIELVGANAAARAVGLEPSPTEVNYFLGNDPKQWRTGVPTFGRVCYESVYPGIDLVYYGNQRQLEYDFVVAPGAEVGEILLRFGGVERIEINATGDLILQTAGGQVCQRCPRVYQELNGRRKEVSGRFVLGKAVDRTVSFAVGAYDQCRPLVIDPVLVYSTFLGGLGLDRAWAITVDTRGCAYLVGETASTNFPTGNPQYSMNGGGLSDVFVAKLGPEGTNLIYSTYLGGSGLDAGFGIALDSGGNVYLTGLTASTNFPVTNAFSTNLHSAAYFGYYTNDAFVAELDATGARLLYSTYLGGGGADEGIAITVDGSGGVYIAGDTLSADFPTNSISPPFGGARDGFVVKLTTASTNLIYSTYLGGSGSDWAQGIAVDTQGAAIISGYTTSLDFPATSNAFQTNFAGGTYDAFVTKLSPDGSTRLFSTYLGGNGDDAASRLVLDGAGNAFLTGITTSTNFPTGNALYSTNNGSEDAFVVKLDPTGTNLIFSTYLGGVFNDEGWSIAVDTNQNVYVVGRTSSTNFPTVNAYQSALNGLNDVFVARLNASGTALDYSTYLGGVFADEGYGIDVDNAGNAYITGMTGSSDFSLYPATNGVQTAFGGGSGDAFVAKLFPRNAAVRAQLSGPTTVTIFWPYGLPNFGLQSADTLNGTNTNWIAVTNTPTAVGDDNVLTFINAAGNMFFRLRRTQ